MKYYWTICIKIYKFSTIKNSQLSSEKSSKLYCPQGARHDGSCSIRDKPEGRKTSQGYEWDDGRRGYQVCCTVLGNISTNIVETTNGNILFLNASRNKAKIRIIPFIPVMLVILVKEFVYLSIFLSIYLSIAVFQFIVLFIYHY